MSWVAAAIGGSAVLSAAMAPDAPDNSGINDAAKANADIAKQSLDWYKARYADEAPQRQAAFDLATKVTNSQLGAMDTQTQLAKEANDYNNSTFRPLERSIVNDANSYDTEANREQLAGKAIGDVNENFANAREQGIRDLTRHGVNPNDGSYKGTAERLALGQALAGATAATKARGDALQLGRAMKMDAASLGRGLPSQQATNTSLAINAGNSAANNGQIPLQVQRQGDATMQQGFTTALNGNQSSGNLYGNAADLQMRSDAATSSGLSNLGMTAAYLYKSDKNAKEGRKPVSGKTALSMARKMPVESWRYKKGAVAGDSGRTHIGPMAQDAHAAGGDALAPGGKAIDSISMHGVTLAAVKALDKKVSRLEKRHA
jgi:hypothetical protein